MTSLDPFREGIFSLHHTCTADSVEIGPFLGIRSTITDDSIRGKTMETLRLVAMIMALTVLPLQGQLEFSGGMNLSELSGQLGGAGL